MEDLKNSFSLRETLEILFPGIFLVALLVPILPDVKMSGLTDNSITNMVVFMLLSLLYGILLYSIDIPKKLWFFKNILPTSIIEKELKGKKININSHKIANEYFSFYDKNISKEQKNKTETYTSIYHFCVNIFITSIILIFIYLIIYKNDMITDNNVLIIFIILFISGFNSVYLIYSNKKIKYMFSRQVTKFKETEFYKNLILDPSK